MNTEAQGHREAFFYVGYNKGCGDSKSGNGKYLKNEKGKYQRAISGKNRKSLKEKLKNNCKTSLKSITI
jgi:hypothetical protein